MLDPEKAVFLRLGVVLLVAITLVWVGLAGSLFITHRFRDNVTVMNASGTLRMHSYRIATQLLSLDGASGGAHTQLTDKMIIEFERRLYHPDLRQALSAAPGHTAGRRYQRVLQLWRERLRPVLNDYLSIANLYERRHASPIPDELSHSVKTPRQAYLRTIGEFTEEVEYLAQAIERHAQKRLDVLRLVGVIPLLLSLLIVGIVLYLSYKLLTVPRDELIRTVRHLRQSDPASPDQGNPSPDRIAGPAWTHLGKLHRELEYRVRDKTLALERSHRSLELLYNTVKQLVRDPLPENVLRNLTRDIRAASGLDVALFCFGEYAGSEFVTLCERPKQEQSGAIAVRPDCKSCRGIDGTHYVTMPGKDEQRHRLLVVPIGDSTTRYGSLLMYTHREGEAENWQVRLLETVAEHVGIAITLRRRSAEHQRLLLLEERGVIARELHDSLAQSLSYLKIKTQHLWRLIRESGSGDDAGIAVRELQDGLSTAYRQLRELLTTFRMKFDGQGLDEALRLTVTEFGSLCNAVITLDSNLAGLELGANQEVHVLQIVREALSNVARHSRAQHARVRLSRRGQDELEVEIRDDGIGMSPAAECRHHYGLAIMHERARSLGARLVVTSPPDTGGTRIFLRFALHPPRPAAANGVAAP